MRVTCWWRYWRFGKECYRAITITQGAAHRISNSPHSLHSNNPTPPNPNPTTFAKPTLHQYPDPLPTTSDSPTLDNTDIKPK